MPKKTSQPSSPSFEQALQELESLVETMEKGEMTLDQSLQAFEQGVNLTRTCQQALDEAEQKVNILMQNTPDAPLEPFEDDK